MVEDNKAPDNSSAEGNEGDSAQWESSEGSEDKGLSVEQQLQKERTNRGREVKSLKDELGTMRATLEFLNAQLSTRSAAPIDDDKPPVEYITTPAELEAYNDWKASKEGKKRKEYAGIYVRAAKGLKYLNPDLHEEIEKELLDSDTRFPSHTNFKDPVKDAELNYRQAEVTVLKRKLSEDKPNVRGGQNPPTGTTATSRAAKTSTKAVELDEFARKFVDSVGEKHDADWVQKSVQREDL